VLRGIIANMIVAHGYGPGRKSLRHRGVNPAAIRAKYAPADNVRPEELAKDLRVTGLTVRNFLLRKLPAARERGGNVLVLTNAQVGAALDHFLRVD
jgi:hypothetical protein